MIVILYASTSGSTAAVAEEMACALGRSTRLLDLKTVFEPISILPPLDLLLAGGPTYGQGDWHFQWTAKLPLVLPTFKVARRVALFGLGDARFHGNTFCGGLGKLYDAVAAAGIEVVGSSPVDKYRYEASPSIRGGVFPGHVIDYRQERRNLRQDVGNWLNTLGVWA